MATTNAPVHSQTGLRMRIELVNQSWHDVFTISKGTSLVKGRHGVYWDLRENCKKISNRFGCYSWRVSDQVHYCGSFSKDYKKREFHTNLKGRLHNYWQNHKVRKDGQKNTNKHVFDMIRCSIVYSQVRLSVLRFDKLILGDRTIGFDDYCNDSNLVKAVEALAICYYRGLGQCTWNRE